MKQSTVQVLIYSMKSCMMCDVCESGMSVCLIPHKLRRKVPVGLQVLGLNWHAWWCGPISMEEEGGSTEHIVPYSDPKKQKLFI
jgi:hypothetical protein